MLLALGLALASSQAALAFDSAKTPAEPVPSNRWGNLQPAGIIGDQTGYSYQRDPTQNNPFWFAVDIENGWLFSVTGRGLMVYDARGANAAEPVQVGYGYGPHRQTQGPGGDIPFWNHSDEDFFLKDLDAPPDVDSMVAVAGREQGFIVWNTSAKNSPRAHYQDLGVNAMAVHSATLGGRHYAFAGTGSGIYLYDLTSAQQHSMCLDTSPAALACSGVYKGKLPGVGGGEFVDGVGNYLIVGRFGNGFDIWNVANPAAPVKVMAANSTLALGVAMWKAGASHYVASVDYSKLRTYDVSCIAGGLCAAPAPLTTISVPGGSAPLTYATFSMSGSTPFVHVGGDDTFSCVVQREFLFKMSNPAAPEDVTPHVHPDGYWGWYYELCGDDKKGGPGFNWVSPRMGKFAGDYFYRSAYSLLDVHQLAGSQPPVANFAWSPSAVYPGTPVNFTDSSSGGPTAWSWTFGDGSPDAAANQNPSGVTFASAGAKSISLLAFNGAGEDSETKTLTVLDPMPKVASVSVSPANPVVCQPITFTANGAGGQPVLSFAWDVKNSSLATVSSGSGNPHTWNTAQSAPLPTAGSYTATVTVANGAGSADASAPFTLGALAALPAQGEFIPTCSNCTAGAPPSGVAQVAVSIPGATEWSWDCGDGSGFGPFLSDPAAASHACSYTSTGAKSIRVKVKNCVEAERTSATLDVTINQITPLKAEFGFSGVSCVGYLEGVFPCSAPEDQPISFTDASTGAEQWEYDWLGNDVWDGPYTQPVTSHVYTSPTTTAFKPRLRVRRGSESDVKISAFEIKIESALPASITVSGPPAGSPNSAVTFSASAVNCSPADSGWVWSKGGGAGSSTSSSISLTWSSSGTKNISATNSACGSASGAHSISISSGPPPPPPPPPTGLAANFTVSASPKAGEPVTFNGSSSTGNPTLYAWVWGDGSPLAASASPTATHTFAAAGTYSVELDVSKVGSCATGFCSASKTLSVTVAAGGPPPPPPPVANFTTDATCASELGFVLCEAEAGEEITFTDASTGTVETRAWNFGDGGTASGAVATHTFTEEGNFTVRLTVTGATKSSEFSRPFTITPAPEPKYALLLPFFAWSQGTLVQVSDFYAFNPGDEPLVLNVYFYKRGTPDPAALPRQITLAPHSAKFVQDALGAGLFNLPNPIIGFLYFTWEGAVEPSVNGVNRTFASDGTSFGQSYPALRVPRLGGELAKATAADTLHVIGLNDNLAKSSSVGIANPFPETATVELRFFDRAGNPLSARVEQIVSGYGQKIFQTSDLQKFGAIGDDFRVEVKALAGGPVFPFGSVVRKGSQDQSYLGSDDGGQQRSHLLGVLNTSGAAGSEWRTDALLFNPAGAPLEVNVVFTPLGLTSVPSSTKTVTLAAFESRRLADIIQALWGVRSVGVLSFSSAAAGGVYPVVVGERYEVSNAAKIFGQASAPQGDGQAAAEGQSVALIGLRQDAAHRSTLFFYNPGTSLLQATLIYRAADGSELARSSLALGGGVARQQVPQSLPAAVLALGGAFTVEAQVTSGKLLAVGQVITNATNDPAQVTGIVY